MIKQSLLKRKPKSKVASNFVGVTGFDKQGRPRVCIVPGSGGKQYQVILRRRGRLITTECRLVAGYAGYRGCPGNGRRMNIEEETICYHSRAAVDYAIQHKFEWDGKKFVASKSNFVASWCTSAEDAQRLVNMNGGTVFNVKSYQNRQGWAWIVVRQTH